MTTTRRGWRAALDSSLLFAIVVCGAVTALLTATPAAAVVGDRTMAVASPAPGATFVPLRTDARLVDQGSRASYVVESNAVAPFESGVRLTGTSESTPRDSAEEDDDDNDDDDDCLERSLSHIPAPGLEIQSLTRIDRDPTVSLESDGHSLRAPPQ